MSEASPTRVAVIGGGPAGLMAAEVLAARGVAVTVYDRMPSVGRKLLLAGRGGLNLTHSEELPRFLARYGVRSPSLAPAIEALTPSMLRDWSAGLGQETFVGSSGRVFPKAFKASPLLRAWLARLNAAGVVFKLRHVWTGWDGAGALSFATPDGGASVQADATVLALGGASWPRLGSDGGWVDALTRRGVAVAPLTPSNCGFLVDWTEPFRARFEGQALKRIALSFGGEEVKGELVVTRTGLEGGAIYALAGRLRDAIAQDGAARLAIDLRPDISVADLARRLAMPRGKQSLSNVLRKAAGLPPLAIALLREVEARSGERLGTMTPDALAARIRAVPVQLTGVAPIERAISTAGGVRFDALDADFMLRDVPGVFAAGEMLDWEAPTGGYLLQASFATGAAAARGVLRWLESGTPPR